MDRLIDGQTDRNMGLGDSFIPHWPFCTPISVACQSFPGSRGRSSGGHSVAECVREWPVEAGLRVGGGGGHPSWLHTAACHRVGAPALGSAVPGDSE